MLRPVNRKIGHPSKARFAIVASRYNGLYVDAMVRAAKAELQRAGIKKIQLVRVPGAFEIPVIAARLAAACHESRITNRTPNESLSGIICFGVIFQGQTSHAQHIGWGVTHALARIQIQYLVPLIHAVFVFEKEEHARVRCLGKKHNRGTEAARTALEMARVIEALD